MALMLYVQYVCFRAVHDRSICSDEIDEICEIRGTSMLSSQDKIQKLPPAKDDCPQDKQEQLHPAMHSVHSPPVQGLTSAFTGGGVDAAGTALLVSGAGGETKWAGWNTTVSGARGVNEGNSSDWCRGNSSSRINKGEVGSGAAAVTWNVSENKYSGSSGGISGLCEEQLVPSPLMTTTTVKGLDRSDSEMLMEAIDGVLGDEDLEVIPAYDSSRRIN